MKHTLTLAAVALVGAFTLSDLAAAHGGTYTGPGDTVPPAGGGGGGGGGPPSGPGTGGTGNPGPSGGGTTGPVSPGGPGGTPVGGGLSGPPTGGGDLGADVTRWQFWWELNKEPYLDLRRRMRDSRVRTDDPEFFIGGGQRSQARDDLAPSAETIRDQVAPALIRALDEESSTDLLSGAMLALARIGELRSESGDAQIAPRLARRLLDGNQELAETATLALGVLGDPLNAPLLIAIAQDDRAALRALGVDSRSDLAIRTRTFATFGLGLLARRMDEEQRLPISEALFALAQPAARETDSRDLRAAALISLANCGLPSDGAFADPGEGRRTTRDALDTREEQVLALLDFFGERSNAPLIRAHAPRTMARLVAEYPSEHWLKLRVANALVAGIGRHTREAAYVQQACALALGQVGDCDGDPIDQAIREALIDIRKTAADVQTRHFALISLGQVGGRAGEGADGPYAALSQRKTSPRSVLLGVLAGGATADRSWAAIALGVLEHSLAQARGPISNDVPTELRAALAAASAPDQVGAYAIGLGLTRDPHAVDVLLDRLERIADPDARGYVGMALGLVGERRAIEPIERVLERSRYQPELLRSSAVALGLLGDVRAVPKMIGMLLDARSLASQASLAAGLGAIGDARSIEPLLSLLGDAQKTAVARGFAAAALGIVSDKDDHSWRNSISVDLDYRANTPTLSSPGWGTGILDLL